MLCFFDHFHVFANFWLHILEFVVIQFPICLESLCIISNVIYALSYSVSDDVLNFLMEVSSLLYLRLRWRHNSFRCITTSGFWLFKNETFSFEYFRLLFINLDSVSGGSSEIFWWDFLIYVLIWGLVSCNWLVLTKLWFREQVFWLIWRQILVLRKRLIIHFRFFPLESNFNFISN
jgi:hypothetical protein